MKTKYKDPNRACTKCKRKPPDIRFYSENYGICNECSCETKRKSREKNPNLDMFNTARARARKRGLEFSISQKDIVIPDVCPIFGVPLVKNKGKTASDCSPTLDRKDSSKGYTKGNIWVISHRANMIKSNATSEELFKVAEAVKKLEDELNAH